MKKINVRCYALIIWNDKILLSKEQRFGRKFTKFIGGGLEWGEGTKACLQREIKEEIGLDAQIGELFYVNDFFQRSAFSKHDQIISFYYFVENMPYEKIIISQEHQEITQDGEMFFWKNLKTLSVNDLTFPIDQIVAEKLVKHLT